MNFTVKLPERYDVRRSLRSSSKELFGGQSDNIVIFMLKVAYADIHDV